MLFAKQHLMHLSLGVAERGIYLNLQVRWASELSHKKKRKKNSLSRFVCIMKCGFLLWAAQRGKTCWHACSSSRIRNQRGGLFLVGMLGEKALIKRSSLAAREVGYQLYCCFSMRPTRLHLVNTFTVPSLTQMWPLVSVTHDLFHLWLRVHMK